MKMRAWIGPAILVLSVGACAPSHAPDNAVAEHTGNEEMGCPGFDPDFVPVIYERMRPCLEQLRWSVELKSMLVMRQRSDGMTADGNENFSLSAKGEQLVWRWEESDTRNGHYDLRGIDNTLDELVVRREGRAVYHGDFRYVDSIHHTQVNVDGDLAGMAADSILSSIDMVRNPERLCVHFDLETQMRGHMTTTVQESGSPPITKEDEPMIIGQVILSQQEDKTWNLDDQFRSQDACTGAPPNSSIDRFDATHWYGLHADEKAGVWNLEATKAVTDERQWTLSLHIERVPLSERLPLHPE